MKNWNEKISKVKKSELPGISEKESQDFLKAMRLENAKWNENPNSKKEEIQEIFDEKEFQTLKKIADKLEMSVGEFAEMGMREKLEIEYISDFLDILPDGFLYKGGAARSAVERCFGVDPNSTPRDIDLVYTEKVSENKELIKEMSEKYMPEDTVNGYGAEALEDDYFNNRDFTFNEVLYNGKKIIATKEAIWDLVNQRIRITDYEKGENFDWWNTYDYNQDLEDLLDRYLSEGGLKIGDRIYNNYDEDDDEYFDEEANKITEDLLNELKVYKEKKEEFMNKNPYIKWKILAKAVRFIMERNIKNKTIDKFSDLDDYREVFKYVQDLGVNEFSIALHLNKSLETGGRKLAEKFLEQIIYLKGDIPEEILSDDDILKSAILSLEDGIPENMKDELWEKFNKEKEFESNEFYDLYQDVEYDDKYEDIKYGDSYIRIKK